MSVVVIGMEKPERCLSCDFQIFSTDGSIYCRRTMTAISPAHTRSPDWCPLRSLPDAHGDLIDRGQLVGRFVPRQAYFTDAIKEKIETAPTILEAECAGIMHDPRGAGTGWPEKMKTEYIEKESAITVVGEAIADGRSWFDALCDFPPADVKPVVRGRWVKSPECPEEYDICSACGLNDKHRSRGNLEHDIVESVPSFCKWCGADMRRETIQQNLHDTKPRRRGETGG